MSRPNESTFPSLVDDVWQALKQWHGDANALSPLRYLYLFRAEMRREAGSERRVTNQVLRNTIEVLREAHFADADFLQKRFLDLLSVQRIANQLNSAESTVYLMQKQAIERLAATVEQLEKAATAALKLSLLERLEPPTYVKLVGVEAAVAQLEQLICTPAAPWVLALEGIGGIGKTSLADTLLRHLIEQGRYDEVGWVTARQMRLNLGGALRSIDQPALTAASLVEKLANQLFPDLAAAPQLAPAELLRRLQARLKSIPHLIVIDNLETVVDIESLLPTLQTLGNPSKFLLTSRVVLRTEPNIYHLPVPELSEEDALQLIRQEAEMSNLPLLAACTDAELRPIYTVVGGNPLALRLVAGQTHAYALEAILQDLQQAQGESAENLYTFIYRRAWDSLDRLTKRVFLTMLLVHPGGESLEFLAATGKFTVGDVRLALNKLVLQSLVDVRGDLHQRRYSIHSLTRTFLQEQVAKWGEDEV